MWRNGAGLFWCVFLCALRSLRVEITKTIAHFGIFSRLFQKEQNQNEPRAHCDLVIIIVARGVLFAHKVHWCRVRLPVCVKSVLRPRVLWKIFYFDRQQRYTHTIKAL